MIGEPPSMKEPLGSVVKLSRHSGESRNPGFFITESFCNSRRFWIPAFAGMTEMGRFHAWQLNLTTRPRQCRETVARLRDQFQDRRLHLRDFFGSGQRAMPSWLQLLGRISATGVSLPAQLLLGFHGNDRLIRGFSPQ